MEVMSSSSTASSSSPIEKSHSTLYSISTKSMISDSGGGGGGGCGSDYHNSDDDDGDAGGNRSDTKSVNSDFELTYCEGDVTLMDEDFSGDATNDAEKMFLQIVEILRDEQEVCVLEIIYKYI